MPVLTVCNHKGGTGKTTTSIHLAAALALQGRRVLVVDFDPQGFLTRMLGAAEPPPEHSGLGLLDAQADLRAFPVQQAGGFDLIGSSMSLTKALRTLTRPTDVLWLRETVRAGHDYDVILLDTAAALSVYTMNALVAADHVVIPVTPEYQPVVGAEQTWQTTQLVRDKLNPALAPPQMVLTQVDARLNRHAKYAEYLREKYGAGVLQTAIRTSSSLAAASRDGRTVYDVQPTARGALDYSAAAAEIARYVFAPSAGGVGAPVAQATAVPSASAPSPHVEAGVPDRSETTAGGDGHAAAPSESAPPAPAPAQPAPTPAASAEAPRSEAPRSEAPRSEAPAVTGGWTPLARR